MNRPILEPNIEVAPGGGRIYVQRPEEQPLLPNGTPVADVGNIGGSLGRAINQTNAAVDQAVETANEVIAQQEQEKGQLIMFAVLGVLGFFVLRNMKVI